MEETNLQVEKDFLNRRTEDLGKVFGMAKSDLVLLIAVISIIGNFILVWKLVSVVENLNGKRIEDIKSFMRTDEGRATIEHEVNKSLEPTKQEVKTTTEEIKQSINEFKEKMQ